MSMRAVEFVETWASENIKPDTVNSPGIDAQAAALASRCIAAAQAAGIPQSEIDETFDDLTAFMAGEIEETLERRAPDSEAEEIEEEEED